MMLNKKDEEVKKKIKKIKCFYFLISRFSKLDDGHPVARKTHR